MNSTSAQNAYPTPNTTPQSAQRRPGIASQTLPIPFLLPPHWHRRRQRRMDRADVIRLAVNKPTIRRLARRGGVKRIRGEIYDTVKEVVEARLREILHHATAIVEHQKRKTLTTLDVVYALRILGNPIYGCGLILHGDNVKCRASYYKIKKKQQADNRERVQRELRAAEEEKRRDAETERVRRVDAGIRAMMRGAR